MLTDFILDFIYEFIHIYLEIIYGLITLDLIYELIDIYLEIILITLDWIYDLDIINRFTNIILAPFYFHFGHYQLFIEIEYYILLIINEIDFRGIFYLLIIFKFLDWIYQKFFKKK